MNGIRVSQSVIAKTINESAYGFNVGTVSQMVRSGTGAYTKRYRASVYRLGSGLPSHLPVGDVPCPSSPSHGFLHHTTGTLNNATCIHIIMDLGMLSKRRKSHVAHQCRSLRA
jgi:hypothetical protein